jgi:hypothetical protein
MDLLNSIVDTSTAEGVLMRPSSSSETSLLSLFEQCPCLNDHNNNTNSTDALDFLYTGSQHHDHHRWLEDEETAAPLWHTVVVAITLVIMFGFMMFDKIGPDWVMTAGLVLFMACEIVSIKDGLVGFSNEGVLTVMALFIVAEGIGRTGALDHYLGMLLGRPKTAAGAMIRLMIPIGILSAFLK